MLNNILSEISLQVYWFTYL